MISGSSKDLKNSSVSMFSVSGKSRVNEVMSIFAKFSNTMQSNFPIVTPFVFAIANTNWTKRRRCNDLIIFDCVFAVTRSHIYRALCYGMHLRPRHPDPLNNILCWKNRRFDSSRREARTCSLDQYLSCSTGRQWTKTANNNLWDEAFHVRVPQEFSRRTRFASRATFIFC